MTVAEIAPAVRALTGTARVPSDKSISHRVAILGALAEGMTRVRGYSAAGDCGATLRVLRALGVDIREPLSGELSIEGLGERIPGAPSGALDCGRSGTTMRLMAGVVAGWPIATVLTGDAQLLSRPMERVAEPLRSMGATLEPAAGGRPPIAVRGGNLTGIEYALPVASAQVKSAVLLAGLRATGTTTIIEPVPTRDHTERLLASMGARIERTSSDAGSKTSIVRGPLSPLEVAVPGDLSSAAAMLVAAALVPGSELTALGVGTNPTRSGLLRVMERMGAYVEVRPREGAGEASAAGPRGEPVADIFVRYSALSATTVGAPEVPSMIDELPLVGLLATQAEGETILRGASELRVKESDRIAALVVGLRALGAEVEELPDGFVVRGPTRLAGGSVDARQDHRLGMTFAVAGLIASGPVHVVGLEFVADSFPGFLDLLNGLR